MAIRKCYKCSRCGRDIEIQNQSGFELKSPSDYSPVTFKAPAANALAPFSEYIYCLECTATIKRALDERTHRHELEISVTVDSTELNAAAEKIKQMAKDLSKINDQISLAQ